MELFDRRDERGGGLIRLTLLGRIDLSDHRGRRIQSVLSQPKRLALLAYLAIETRSRMVRRDELTAVFWPRRNDARARKALRDALYFLRRSLGDAVILTPGDEVGLNWDRIECDAREAAELHQGMVPTPGHGSHAGEFMAGFHVSGAPGFEKWVDSKRPEYAAIGSGGASALPEAPQRSLPAGSATDRGGLPPRRTGFEGWWPAGVVALLGGGIVAGGLLLPFGDSTAEVVSRYFQLTFSGTVERAQISPDGQLLAYVDGGDDRHLRLRDIESGSVISLASIGNPVHSLRWSPDGARLLFVGFDSTGQWKAVEYPRLGGSPRPLRIPSGWVAQHAIWSPDASRIASWHLAADSLLITDLATGHSIAFPLPDSVGQTFHSGDWSPNGDWIALGVISASPPSMSLWTVSSDGARWRQLVRDTVPLMGPRWSPSSDAVYYIRGDELRKATVGPDGGPQGYIKTLESGLEVYLDEFPAAPSVTVDGRRLLFPRSVRHSNVWLVARGRDTTEPDASSLQITRGSVTTPEAVLAPDGDWIAYTRGEGSMINLYAISRREGRPIRLTTDGNVSVYIEPAWSPDGRAIAFAVWDRGDWRLRTVQMSDGRVRTYDHVAVGGSGLVWTRDYIVYSRPENRNFHLLDPQTGTETPLVQNDSVGWMFWPVVSPDGEQVAVWWNRDPRGAWVVSLDGTSQQLVRQGMVPLGWAADGKSLFVREQGAREIFRVPVSGGEPTLAAEIPFDEADCLTYDRTAEFLLLCTVQEAVSDAWMIENFDQSSN